jgi:hypothetical protein
MTWVSMASAGVGPDGSAGVRVARHCGAAGRSEAAAIVHDDDVREDEEDLQTIVLARRWPEEMLAWLR